MSDYDRNRRRLRDDGFGWGIPAAIVAGLLILGGLWYANSGARVTTAANNATPATQTGPVAPRAPAPGPTTTAPVPNR